MLLAIVLAATLSFERAPLDPAEAVLPVPEHHVVLLQRGAVIWTFDLRTGRERRLASDTMFADAKIERAFRGGNRIYVSAGTALYDLGMTKRLAIGHRLRSAHIAPDNTAAILETVNGPAIWLRFRDNEWKELPASWSFSEEFARDGAWAVFDDRDDDGMSTRAVDVATGELQFPKEPEPPQPTEEEPLVVSVSFGPELDLGEGPVIETRDATESGARNVAQQWSEHAGLAMLDLPRLTVEEAKTLPMTHQQPEPRVHPSFDGRAAILELPVSMTEEEIEGRRAYGLMPYRVRWHTLLVLPDGSRHPLQLEIPRGARLHVDDSGNFLIVREKGLVERVKVEWR